MSSDDVNVCKTAESWKYANIDVNQYFTKSSQLAQTYGPIWSLDLPVANKNA